MKTKTAVILPAALVAVYAVGLAAATVLVDAPTETPKTELPAQLNGPRDAVIVVTPPPTTFDLEATSPAVFDEADALDRDQPPAPTPDLTWYDPHGLEEIGRIS